MCPPDEPADARGPGVGGEAGDAAAELVARADSVFREANDSLMQQAARRDVDPEHVPVICECADPRCTRVFLLDLGTYERIRSNARWFVVVPTHEDPEGRTAVVVERYEGFLIVEKTGQAGEVAEQLVDSEPEGSEEEP